MYVKKIQQVIIFCFIILQELEPYNKGAFKIEIVFPAEYPFRPPKVGLCCFDVTMVTVSMLPVDNIPDKDIPS